MFLPQGNVCPDRVHLEVLQLRRGHPVEQRGGAGAQLVHLHQGHRQRLPGGHVNEYISKLSTIVSNL